MDKCCYCERPIPPPYKPTAEHIVPRSKGGSNEHCNIRTCCFTCNQWRGNKDYDTWYKEVQRDISVRRRRRSDKGRRYSKIVMQTILTNIEFFKEYVAIFGEQLKIPKRRVG